MLWVIAIPALVLAAYAYYRLPAHTRPRWALWATGIFLVALGVGVGWATSFRYFPAASGSDQLALFLFGFGIAHFPAAAVLFLKHWQRQTG